MKNIILLLLTMMMASCHLEDERDACCEEVVLDYRYVKLSQDEYRRYVRQMRHYLFDDQGVYLGEYQFDKKQPQQLRFRGLPVGTYQMVSFGNTTDANTYLGQLTPKKSKLSDLKLEVVNQKNGYYHNGDKLYYSYRKFQSELDQRHRYLCDVSNIHALLDIRVKWEDLPPHSGDYEFYLEKVANQYDTNPLNNQKIKLFDMENNGEDTPSLQRVVHQFLPNKGIFGTHYEKVPLIGNQLNCQFITLRYTDLEIPTLSVYSQGNQIVKPLDLSVAFQSWGWFPSKSLEQHYLIDVLIKKDGSIVVSPRVTGDVLDWSDGGTVQ